MNPYYNTTELGFEKLEFNGDIGYEFDLLIFLSNQKGQIYTAQDRGCSCYKPFEDYEGENQNEVEQKLERIGSIKQAKQIFNTWNNSKQDRNNKSESEMQIEMFFKEHFVL